MIDASELRRRWKAYEEAGIDPAERISMTVLGPLYADRENLRELMSLMRVAAESNLEVRDAFREVFLTHWGFVPGENLD